MSNFNTHTHHHHHHPSHGQGQHHESVVQANKDYFDDPKNDYQNNLEFKELAARWVLSELPVLGELTPCIRAARAILNSCTMDKEKTTVMDFACGIGQ